MKCPHALQMEALRSFRCSTINFRGGRNFVGDHDTEVVISAVFPQLEYWSIGESTQRGDPHRSNERYIHFDCPKLKILQLLNVSIANALPVSLERVRIWSHHSWLKFAELFPQKYQSLEHVDIMYSEAIDLASCFGDEVRITGDGFPALRRFSYIVKKRKFNMGSAMIQPRAGLTIASPTLQVCRGFGIPCVEIACPSLLELAIDEPSSDASPPRITCCSLKYLILKICNLISSKLCNSLPSMSMEQGP